MPTIKITSLSHGGSGVGRLPDAGGELVVFVPMTAPGDLAEVRITQTKKNYAEGELVNIIETSPHRISPPCPVFGRCGGCQWQHVSYSEQLRQKQLMVNHALQRIAKEENVEIRDIVPSPKEFHYRNRVQFRTDGPAVGFYQRHSHELVTFDECLIAEQALNTELAKIREEIRNQPAGKLDKVEVAVSTKGEIIRTRNRSHGEDTGFSQVNTAQNENLQKHIADILGKPMEVDADNVGSRGNLLDLYCGSGNFSFPLNKNGWRVYGVDMSRPAITTARLSANSNTFFSAADCSNETKKLANRGRKFEAVLLDPPRVGADESLWPELMRLEPDKILYVSCNPATFARDWARLKKKGGYKLVLVAPFDMFPQTYHVELVALAKRS